MPHETVFLPRREGEGPGAQFSVLAERNLVPSMDSASNISPDRPKVPQWTQDVGVRDTHRRVLVQDIYLAQRLERFASAERWEMLEASDAYGCEANVLRPQVMSICEAEGNW